MPTKRMLVDATHPEETRVVVTSGSKLEEFDFESASRRQLRGNIYLAKVTRVEPSLQAAFVDYGGNRHGFLAFSEIHPDYYQIPLADREALMAEYAEAAEQNAKENDEKEAKADKKKSEKVDEVEIPKEVSSSDESTESSNEPDGEKTIAAEATVESVSEPAEETDNSDDAQNATEEETTTENESDNDDDDVDSMGGDDAIEEAGSGKRGSVKRYKIQEVIKRRQVMLIQVVKEERGNKGAALTTYLSLAGRYSVLMPNTARGGGISRKITNSADRKRLKEIASELEVPQGMGVILRTAGASRTKPEVTRDFEYLARLWENVRSMTLKSTAPNLVYEEGSLIKRTIRDLYNKDIDEVWVAGDDAYREAKDFMAMIMPTHAKNVQHYTEDQSIFSRYNVESQLDSMFSPQVTLPSGGYIVINPTEALVSVDVNSGRATKEHNIEDTALQTNLETADELARQLRLRDLAGLIVIDFIDMMDKRSIRAVERRLKDALKNDRARIQVGRISHFGLLEMSRQRMRAGVLEGSTHICPTCQGNGVIRSVESLSLMVMRAIEDHVVRKSGISINVRVPMDVALYILNVKRAPLADMESKHQISITLEADGTLVGSQFHIEKAERQAHAVSTRAQPVRVDSGDMDTVDDASGDAEAAPTPTADGENGEETPRPRRRRRRRGGRDRQERTDQDSQEAVVATDVEITSKEDDTATAEANTAPHPSGDEDEDGPRKRRRRGRRGGRRNRRPEDENGENTNPSESQAEDVDAQSAIEGSTSSTETAPVEQAQVAQEPASKPETADVANEEKPVKKPRRPRRKKADVVAEDAPQPEVAAEAASESVAEKKPTRRRRKPAADKTAQAAAEPAVAKAETAPAPAAEPAEAPKPKKDLPPEGVIVTSSAKEGSEDVPVEAPKKKAGWWQRGFLAK